MTHAYDADVCPELVIAGQHALYEIEKGLHVLSGSLAAFLVFPLAALARKDSLRHRQYGYIATLLACAVALTGTLMLFNPMFPSLWAQNVRARGVEWQLFFAETFYEPAFFLWLDILLLYACLSSVRVWVRVRSVAAGAAHSFAALDVLLTVLLALSSGFFVGVGIRDIVHLAVHPFATLFVGLGLYGLGFAAVDVASFCLPGRLLLRYGWVLHGYKFLFAWHGLITAFFIRMRISYQAFTALDTVANLLGYLSTGVLLWLYLRSQKPVLR